MDQAWIPVVCRINQSGVNPTPSEKVQAEQIERLSWLEEKDKAADRDTDRDREEEGQLLLFSSASRSPTIRQPRRIHYCPPNPQSLHPIRSKSSLYHDPSPLISPLGRSCFTGIECRSRELGGPRLLWPIRLETRQRQTFLTGVPSFSFFIRSFPSWVAGFSCWVSELLLPVVILCRRQWSWDCPVSCIGTVCFRFLITLSLQWTIRALDLLIVDLYLLHQRVHCNLLKR